VDVVHGKPRMFQYGLWGERYETAICTLVTEPIRNLFGFLLVVSSLEYRGNAVRIGLVVSGVHEIVARVQECPVDRLEPPFESSQEYKAILCDSSVGDSHSVGHGEWGRREGWLVRIGGLDFIRK